MKNIQALIDHLFDKYSSLNEGNLATYIPELAHANTQEFGISITTVHGETFSVGSTAQFSMQSVSKPFTYALALEDHGPEFLMTKIGVEPTGNAFNSLVELEEKSHRPYNPMINSGAITASSYIKGQDGPERLRRILKLFEDFLGHKVHVDMSVFLSEKKTAHRNRAIAHLLRHFGVIESDIEECLDLYFQQCSILVNTQDLSLLAATLAGGGVQPRSRKQVIKKENARDLLALMFTCGMYDSSGEWAYKVGLPAKSGVSGGIIAVAPGKLGIGVYSPLLDSCGHSVRSVKVIEELSRELGLNIFNGAII